MLGKRSKGSADKEGTGAQESQRKSTASAESILVVEVVICIPKMAVTIPCGKFKDNLQESGYVNHMDYKRSDSSDTIRRKIVSALPKV